MKVDVNKFWIEGVLKAHFTGFEANNGVDLNQDGHIKDKEIFGDLNQNGIIGDREDYQIYLRKSRKDLSNAIPFFKYGEKFLVENRIHQLMYLESDLNDPAKLETAYRVLKELADDAQQRISQDRTVLPETKAQSIYAAMRASDIHLAMSVSVNSLIQGINQGTLDCDTSSFAAMAIGDELGIALNTVSVPEHVFLRGYGNDGKEFNIDYGWFASNAHYMSKFNISEQLIQGGVYLVTHSDSETESLFASNRGFTLWEMDRKKEALAAFDRAIRLNPKDATAHNNYGFALEEMNHLQEALAVLDQAILLDRKLAEAHHNRGLVFEKMNRLDEALASFDQAILLDKKHAEAHYHRGLVFKKMNRLDKALLSVESLELFFEICTQ